jgi:hypothetical protein
MAEPCAACSAMDLQRDDALASKRLEIVETIHNPCAPVTHYVARCRTCGVRWLATEVYDEDGERPSEWSWAPGDADPSPAA